MQIQQALNAACSALGLERLDAQLLLLHALGKPQNDRAWLLAHDADTLDSSVEMRYINLTRRRAAGTPLAYLTGQREFYGLTLQIDARVLDPRPDTETLVDWALECVEHMPAPHIIDLGVGSGAIALAIKSKRASAEVLALDASRDALDVAQANAQHLSLQVEFMQGHWLDAVDQRFDLIVSNPPYIAEDDPHLPKLGHEPQQALVSGADGLRDIRHIVAQARTHLHPQGWLLLEHGWRQAEAVRALLSAAGLTQVQSRRDLQGIERCSGGIRPA